jgi:hypothetical protein
MEINKGRQYREAAIDTANSTWSQKKTETSIAVKLIKQITKLAQMDTKIQRVSFNRIQVINRRNLRTLQRKE